MHYVDEGGKDHPVVLLLHGEPTWSYLYRKMILLLTDKGFRVIAPDLIGFGKSDKFTDKGEYTYQRSVEWMKAFLLQLDLTDVVLFCQDWGGLIGLRVVAELPDRFSMVIASNTGLPTGEVKMPKAFHQWLEFSQSAPDINAGFLVNLGALRDLSDEEIAAYNAPFPTEEYKAAFRVYPSLVPIAADDPQAGKTNGPGTNYASGKSPS